MGGGLKGAVYLSASWLLLGSGCAVTPETIHIDYPRSLPSAPGPGAAAVCVLVDVKDLRSYRDAEVARKMNGEGTELAPIYLDEDAKSLVRRAVEMELQARGFTVGSGQARVQIELTAFRHEFLPGFPAGISRAEVAMAALVTDASGRQCYSGTVEAEFQQGIQLCTGEKVKLAFEKALPAAVRRLLDRAEFQQALVQAAAIH